MFANEQSTFHDSVKPIIYFNWILGMGVARQPNLSNSGNICMHLYTIIFTLVNWILNYIALAVMMGTRRLDDSTQRTACLIMRILVLTNSFIATTAPVLMWLQKKGFNKCLRHLPLLDEAFQDILGARTEYRKQYIGLIRQVLATVLFSVLEIVCDVILLYPGQQSGLIVLITQVILHYPIIVMVMLDLNFCSLAGYLRKKFQDLNNSLLRVAEKPSSSSYRGKKMLVISRNELTGEPEGKIKDSKTDGSMKYNHYLLREIRKMHLELCKLSRRINLVFGIQNLVSLGTSFVMVTGFLYTIYSTIVLKDSTTGSMPQVIPMTVWAAIYSCKIWIINHSCWSVSNEALRTGELIYDLLESKVDKEFQKEIQEFGFQMLQNPVRFDACGFFTLDYSFVQGVIGSITTYLIILIQMNHNFERSTPNVAVAVNSTEISAN